MNTDLVKLLETAMLRIAVAQNPEKFDATASDNIKAALERPLAPGVTKALTDAGLTETLRFIDKFFNADMPDYTEKQ